MAFIFLFFKKYLKMNFNKGLNVLILKSFLIKSKTYLKTVNKLNLSI
ncbi:hypothetical protein BBU29805_B20 (plasmid) [Borreliella burgdorferi 29805]|nr:hypothetical protein BBU29805_B20 [Borreliella burgdorferi 29805]